MGFSFHSLKKSQAATAPVQKPRQVMHPLNAPITMPVVGGRVEFPENFEEYEYLGPTAEMVPRHITLGVERRLAVVAQLERSYQVGDVTVREQVTATPADLRAYYDKMVRENNFAAANKIADLSDMVVNGSLRSAGVR